MMLEDTCVAHTGECTNLMTTGYLTEFGVMLVSEHHQQHENPRQSIRRFRKTLIQ